MEIKNIKRIKKVFLGKKKGKIFKLKEKEKGSILFENSTDFSSINLISLEEKSRNNSKIPSLDDMKIPSFLNDITKYNDINKKIKKYYEIEKNIGSQELAKIFLIDVKRLYEEKKKI